MQSELSKDRRWRLGLLALAFATLFLLLHPYRGMVHDSRLYAIQALGHLRPEIYGNDIFLRLGSQDDYTFFSPLFAWTVSWLGLEPAAAALTFFAIVLFLSATWLLARHLLSAEQAAISMVLVVLVPAFYGPSHIFHYLEEFATPRQLAEALTLFCLLAWLAGRRALSCGLAMCGLLIHPIIGAMGVAIIPSYEWIAPRWRRFLPVAALGILLAGMATRGLIPVSRWQFDVKWYEIVMNRTYLRLFNWNIEDWGRIATVLATLACAGMTLPDRLQRLATAGLNASVMLLLVAVIGGDILRIVIVVQAQPWRVMWITTLLAILLLPRLCSQSWRGPPLARCSILLLCAAWASPQGTVVSVAALLATLSMLLASQRIPERTGHLLQAGSWMVLVIALLHGAAVSALSWNEGLTRLESLPPLLDRILTLSQGGLIPALVLIACWYLLTRFPQPLTKVFLASIASIAIAALIMPIASTWTNVHYDESAKAAFAEWRALIPPESEVMWTGEDSLWGDGALNAWLLLERPSYVSGTQAPNALFSRAAAIEMQSRTQKLWGLLPFTDPFRAKGSNLSRPERPLLASVCQSTSVRYVVTSATMSDAQPVPAPTTAPLPLRDYKLYICT